MLRRLLPVLILSSLLACQKNDSGSTIDFGAGEGLTYRDVQNLPNGPQDPSDWSTDATWNPQERALFPELGFDLNGAQQPNSIGSNAAFPNPAQAGQANWTLQTQRNSSGGAASYTLRAVFVNRRYEVIQRLGPTDFILSQTYAFDYAQMGLPAKELFRLYYVVYNASGLVYKGHGDLRYSP